MCAKCDNKIGKLDGYINKILNHILPKQGFTKELEGSQCRVLASANCNIDMLHKFFISLW
ncbi:hypothetical protein BKH46_02165 [Helicobacter sp. 12S02634-8]|nr:hypothetical protein BKH46_02165 [Helicobacter sp. 12S02634-8]